MNKITKEITSRYYYDETSPSCLRHSRNIYFPNGGVFVSSGDVAGSLTTNGYWCVKCDGTTYPVHRIILAIFNKNPEELFVDHINGERSDNRIVNLRVVTRRINARNCKIKNNNKTGFNGVSYSNNGKGNFYFKARYRDILKNKEVIKNFSILKYGYDEALRLAIKWREEKIAEMNNIGAGYTERHGKEE